MKRLASALAAFWILLAVGWSIGAIVAGASARDLIDDFALSTMFVAISYPGMGAVIAARQPRNALAWVYLAIGSVALSGPLFDYAVWALMPDVSAPGAVTASWLANWIWFPGFGVLLTFSLLLFPDGRLPSPRWRVVAWGAALGVALTAVDFAATAWLVRGPRGLEMSSGEFDVLASPLPGWVGAVGGILMALGGAAGVASLFFRYKRASGVERQQLKWVMYAGALTVVGFQIIIANPDNPEMYLLPLFVIPLIPTATAVAILRYRLYDIDVVINRTLVYGSLTAILAAAYFGLVALFQTVLAPLTEGSDLAVVASTLAVAALFRPARSRVQSFIDRRFYRSRYDATKTIETFSARLRDQVELHHLRADLVKVVQESLAPAHASLWLREDARPR